jgi:gamma-glutamylcyclotransferase (GGCT)/AIG2-like uncharacterized protein YtfP
MPEGNPMESLFAYGTLMCPEIMTEVSGRHYAGHPATLDGHVRRPVIGEAYPGLTSCREGRVRGILYRDVTEDAWQRLDRFEGEMYERRTVEVTLHEKRVIAASTYLVKAAFLHRLGKDEWDYERFLRCGIEDFRRQYSGYREIG